MIASLKLYFFDFVYRFTNNFIGICYILLQCISLINGVYIFLQVVGLGNYILPDTRHSVGMLVVDCLGKQLGTTWQFNKKSMGHLAVTKMNDQRLILLKPTVVMNVNGKSIVRAGTVSNFSRQ